MTLIQLFVLLFCLFAITRTGIQLRAGTISPRRCIFWILFWMGVGVVTILPEVSNRLARFVGVGRGADVVVYCSILALFYLVFRLYVKNEETQSEMTRLVRALALREESSHKK